MQSKGNTQMRRDGRIVSVIRVARGDFRRTGLSGNYLFSGSVLWTRPYTVVKIEALLREILSKMDMDTGGPPQEA